MCEHFAHCSHFFLAPARGARKNTTQLVKYTRVLSAKPSNKVYAVEFPRGRKGHTGRSTILIKWVHIYASPSEWFLACPSSSDLAPPLPYLFTYVFTYSNSVSEATRFGDLTVA